MVELHFFHQSILVELLFLAQLIKRNYSVACVLRRARLLFQLIIFLSLLVGALDYSRIHPSECLSSAISWQSASRSVV